MKELWIDLQPDSPHALYEQIYEYIRKDIADDDAQDEFPGPGDAGVLVAERNEPVQNQRDGTGQRVIDQKGNFLRCVPVVIHQQHYAGADKEIHKAKRHVDEQGLIKILFHKRTSLQNSKTKRCAHGAR